MSVPYLCGGTFFVILMQFRKGARTRNTNLYSKNGFTEAMCLEELVKTFYDYTRCNAESTFKKNTNEYKLCKIDSSSWLRFDDVTLIDEFDGRVKNSYGSKLKDMDCFLMKCIDVQRNHQRIVNVLLEVIDKDEKIKGTDKFYINKDGSYITKKGLLNLKEIDFQPFILGVWHYIIMNRNDNVHGEDTITDWMKNSGVQTVYKYNGPAGNGYIRKINILTDEDSFIEKQQDYEEILPIVTETMNSQELLNEKIMASGQAVADAWRNVMEKMVADINEPVRNEVLYVSTAVSSKKELRDENVKIINQDDGISIDQIEEGNVYQLTTEFSFDSVLDESGTRSIKVWLKIDGFRFRGMASCDNWKSKSYMNNIASAGRCNCIAWFEVLAINDNDCVVQWLKLERKRK